MDHLLDGKRVIATGDGRGSIVNIASVGGVVGMTRSAAQEFANRGVRVESISYRYCGDSRLFYRFCGADNLSILMFRNPHPYASVADKASSYAQSPRRSRR